MPRAALGIRQPAHIASELFEVRALRDDYLAELLDHTLLFGDAVLELHEA